MLLFMRFVNATDEHKGIIIYLTIFTMSCHSLYHLTRASRSACYNVQSTIDKIIFAILQSTANWKISQFLIIFTRPSVYITYEIGLGPRDEPCGTPDIVSNVEDITLLTRT